MRLNLNEITVPTIQGEGAWMGRPSVFVRVQGCSIRCGRCDTKKSWDQDEGTTFSIEAILAVLKANPRIDVVITGGEPLDPMHVEGVAALCKALLVAEHPVTIETSGMVPWFDQIEDMLHWVDLWSISPKLRGMSPMVGSQFNDELIGRMTYGRGNVQLKFVVDVRCAHDEIKDIGELIGDGGLECVEHLILQPMTRPNDGVKAILKAWADLAKIVMGVPWLVKLRPQIIPQCHKLVGMV